MKKNYQKNTSQKIPEGFLSLLGPIMTAGLLLKNYTYAIS